jgi:two-component system, chemotaxis family, protein-glutamate methylesterase/glutaminase
MLLLLQGNSMNYKNIIVVGSSYGGIDALKILAEDLPQDLPASIFIVQHLASNSPGILPEIITNAGALSTSFPSDYEKIRQGRIYVAPPDRHLLIENGFIRITRGPKENRFRPAIDVLFRSAAYIYGPRVVGVVLTGFLDDGTAGLWAIKYRGGTTIVQNPGEARASSMPKSALQNVKVDYCLPLKEIAPLIVQLAQTVAGKEGEYPMSESMKVEVAIAKEKIAIDKGVQDMFEPSFYTCPECHGVLLQINEGENFRFRCHAGHAYSCGSLLKEGEEEIEDSIWAAIRSLEERIMLLRQLAENLQNQNKNGEAELMVKKAGEAELQADQIRQILVSD